MFIYYIATHQIFFWIAMASALIGNMFVAVFLKEAFFSEVIAHGKQRIRRQVHYGVFGLELKVLALLLALVYVACYPGPVPNILLAAYSLWVLMIAVLVNTGAARVKRRQKL